MQIQANLHRIKIPFQVTETVERFVYIYVIFGKKIHIIDAGTANAEKIIIDYLEELGKNIKDVSSLLLTHSHPDHIGGAKVLKNLSDCTIYAFNTEKNWIENIDMQFKERPIPNFYTLLNQSVCVDKTLYDDDILILEDEITIKVIETKGHSQGCLSFHWIEENILFTGDAIPVIGEIPIYISNQDSVNSLKKILEIKNITYYLSAWDDVFKSEDGICKVEKAIEHLTVINSTVKEIMQNPQTINKEDVYKQVCNALNMNHLINNPLFQQSIDATIEELVED